MCDSSGLGICDAGSDGGMLMPFFGEDEQKWPTALRAILYLFGMVWCFLGVAIIADLFMEAIEQITSKVTITTDKVSGKKRVRRFWNPTVANLSLMALGSSAPEIMLNVMEIVVGGPKGPFHAGDLGPSTIVGSAAFNLLVISAVVVTAITEGTKKIEQMQAQPPPYPVPTTTRPGSPAPRTGHTPRTTNAAGVRRHRLVLRPRVRVAADHPDRHLPRHH